MQADQGVRLGAHRAKLELHASLYGPDLIGAQVDGGISAETLDRSAVQPGKDSRVAPGRRRPEAD